MTLLIRLLQPLFNYFCRDFFKYYCETVETLIGDFKQEKWGVRNSANLAITHLVGSYEQLQSKPDFEFWASLKKELESRQSWSQIWSQKSMQSGHITVYIEGAVNKPGRQELDPPLTIAHAIQQAGGVHRLPNHRYDRAEVIRKGFGVFSATRGDYDLHLADGDRIEIQSRP